MNWDHLQQLKDGVTYGMGATPGALAVMSVAFILVVHLAKMARA